jgi:hypothetical protein
VAKHVRMRERTDKLVRELVLDDPAPFVPLVMKKRGKETDYEAKTVMLAGRRYIVCRNGGEGCCRSGFDRSRTGATRRWSATPAIAAT